MANSAWVEITSCLRCLDVGAKKEKSFDKWTVTCRCLDRIVQDATQLFPNDGRSLFEIAEVPIPDWCPRRAMSEITEERLQKILDDFIRRIG